VLHGGVTSGVTRMNARSGGWKVLPDDLPKEWRERSPCLTANHYCGHLRLKCGVHLTATMAGPKSIDGFCLCDTTHLVGINRERRGESGMLMDVVVKERASIYAILRLTSCDLRICLYYF
jgi:hypothetical protein